MSNARNLADLLGSTGDVKSSALDNAPAPTKSSIDALGIAATSLTGSQATAITNNTAKTGITSSQASELTANNAKVGITTAQASELTANNAKVTNYNQTKADIDALGIAATSVTGSQASAITANSAKVTNYNQTQSDINALGITATSVDLGNWTITESSGVMYFATGGTNKMKLDASGNLTCVGDVTASGTI